MVLETLTLEIQRSVLTIVDSVVMVPVMMERQDPHMASVSLDRTAPTVGRGSLTPMMFRRVVILVVMPAMVGVTMVGSAQPPASVILDPIALIVDRA